MKSLREAGAYVIAAHPYWCGFTDEELMPLREQGVKGLEVYNATCRITGRSTSSVHWDQWLAKGWRLPAVAVDDVHNDSALRMGWTMVKAEALTLDAVMDALHKGAFYASTGPEIRDLRVEGDTVTVECSPVRKIQFYATAPKGAQFVAEDPSLTRGEFKVKRPLDYVRVEVTDAEGRQAWSPPLYFD